MSETEAATVPRVWAGCWACYNAGALVGDWIEVPETADELGEAVAAMLRGPGHRRDYAGEVHEEHGWFDHEGFEGYRLGESASFETVATVAAAIREHGGAFAAWFGSEDGLDPADFDECYLGEWDDLEAWAWDHWESLGYEAELERLRVSLFGPDNGHRGIMAYALKFDAASYAHDCKCSGDIWTVETGSPRFGVWVFSSR